MVATRDYSVLLVLKIKCLRYRNVEKVKKEENSQRGKDCNNLKSVGPYEIVSENSETSLNKLTQSWQRVRLL